MHDVCLMAVVDAREDLLHEDGAVALTELAALQNLVEELTTLANPGLFVSNRRRITYSVTR